MATSSSIPRAVTFTALAAMVISVVAQVIDLSSGKYGGASSELFLCLSGVAGVFGMLGARAWYKLKGENEFGPVDPLPLGFIAFIAGLFPFICVLFMPK